MKHFLFCFLCLIFCYTASAQVAQNVPFVNGGVKTILRYNNNLYILGAFTVIGTDSNYNGIGLLDAHTSAPQAWNPAPNGAVSCMILQSGKLIVGGYFTTIAGQSRNGIAIFDAATGALDPMAPSVFNSVYALCSDSNTIYCAGTSGNGLYIQNFDITTGAVSGWQSGQFLDPPTSIAKSGNYVYVGGTEMRSVSLYQSPEYDVMRFNATSGAVDSAFMANSFIDQSYNHIVLQILPYMGRIYIAGEFELFNNNTVDGFLALDSNGNLTSFDVFADNNENFSLFAQGNYLWVGGNSYSFDGSTTYYAAQIDINTDKVTCWVKPEQDILFTGAIYVQSDTVYIGFYGTLGNVPIDGGFEMAVGNVATGPVSVSLSASNTILCPSVVDTFFATVTNNAPITTYEWYRNGIPVIVTTTPVFTSDSLSDGDSIQVSATNNLCNESTAFSSYIHIHVKPLSRSNISASFCQGSSYLFNGQNLSQAGTYTDTMTGQNGCDSIITLHLTVNLIDTTHISQTICSGSIYYFNGNYLFNSGVYSETLTSMNGCDSIVILTLSVGNISLDRIGGICTGTDTLSLVGASAATKIQWIYNGTTISTEYPDTLYETGMTVAGMADGTGGSAPNQLNTPLDVFVSNGYIYVSDASNNRVQAFPPGSTAGTNAYYTAAGGNGQGPDSDQLSNPYGIFLDNYGNLYVADAGNWRIQMFNGGSANGLTVGGGNGIGFSANQIQPNFINVDGNGNVYAGDDNGGVQEFPAGSTSATNEITLAGYFLFGCVGISVDPSGNIYTGAWNSVEEFPPGGNSSTTNINTFGDYMIPEGIKVDRSGNIYVADRNSNSVLKFPPGSGGGVFTGIVVAGGNGAGNAANQLNGPAGIYIDGNNNVYVADANNNRIQKWSPKDSIGTTYIPTTPGSYSAIVSFNGCTVRSDTVTIYPVSRINVFDTICLSPDSAYFFGTNSITQSGTYVDTFTSAQGCDSIVTLSLTIAAFPSINISEKGNPCIIGADTLTISGSYCYPILWLQNGSLVAIDTPVITTVAGGNGDSSASNQLAYPEGVYLDSHRNIFIADTYNQRIQEWASGATTGTTVVWTGGNGTAANQLSYPTDVLVDSIGNIYVADFDNNRIQKWTQATNSISTVAGSSSGQSGITSSLLSGPSGIFVDATGNIYIADFRNNRVQKWAQGASNGITVAGDSAGSSGNAANLLSNPRAVAVDANGNIYVADMGNNRIQKWAPGANTGTTVAGNTAGVSGSASNLLYTPTGIFVDGSANIYVSDNGNSRIQKWAAGANTGSTVAGGNGNGGAYNQLSGADGVWLDNNGDIYTADQGNFRIQKYTQNHNYVPTSPGSYIATVTNAYGCSATSNAIIIQNSSSSNLFDTICAGSSFTFGGHNYSQSGTYTDTLTSVHGCDSIILLNIFVYPTSVNNVFDSICSGSSVLFGGHSYSQAGAYSDTLTSMHGCDIISTLHVFVRPTYGDTMNVTICQGDSFDFNGNILTTTETQYHYLTSISGCDSTVILNLTVNPTSSINLYDTLVTGDTLYMNGHAYTQSGIYYDTLSNIHGCDSVQAIYLYVATTSTFAHLFDTICQGFSVVLGNHTYTVSGTYVDTLTGTYGGDSVVTLNLTINQALLVNINDTISQGASVTVGTNTYSQPGTYVDTLTSIAGCDSIVALHLYVATGIVPLSSIRSINVYPNPNQGSFTIAVDGISSAALTAEVTDMLGRSIYKQNIHSGENKLDLSLTPGVYTVRVSDGNTSAVRMMTIK